MSDDEKVQLMTEIAGDNTVAKVAGLFRERLRPLE